MTDIFIECGPRSARRRIRGALQVAGRAIDTIGAGHGCVLAVIAAGRLVHLTDSRRLAPAAPTPRQAVAAA